jgi:class 3 adenylate cyclase/tetratricopeptide (TPR) repeat protein
MQFRRLVTVLFVDVVESMAIADALDAEALGRVLSGYFETVSAALTRHGGTVEKYAGDAVMAVFGIPVSHEDDALRAARAALDIRAAVAALNQRLVEAHGVGLEIRIGLETGEVVTTPTEMRQRLVTGEAVGIASRLQQAAGSGEIVVGELAARLIDHAARLDPLGELEIKGKREPVRAFRLLEIEAVAPAFGRRLDASLVGRKRELAALRRALKRAVDGSAVRVAVVVGTPGVGKSRLVGELARRAKGATTLWGRCLSYGEGITYWPLREVVQQAGESEEREAILAALDADTPPPAPEIAWRFRKLCEALAREQPLVLVLDDVHWAEPTFLELVEHVADKGEGPILVVCVAREELLEERPTFLEDRTNVERIVLEALSADETDALLEGLGGAVLESDQRRRIVETAEGNPLFLEQLLALTLEGGLAERSLPETIQSLLAARLDRLGPGERAILERAAVVGREFTADDLESLLDPDAAPTAHSHLKTLAGRGFVRPRGDGRFGFRHVLVQQAVYRAAPKRLRAELHESFADRLDRTAHDLAELDEFAGYHLEQSYRLRTELGESDLRTERLADHAARRLGEAGMRASRRGDAPAAIALLQRATSIQPPSLSLRSELLVELGIPLRVSGDLDMAGDAFESALELSGVAGDRRIELRARVELEYIRVTRDSGMSGDALIDATSAAIPVFEAARDHRSLGRAWLLAGWVQGSHRGHHKAREEAAERALSHYKRSTWPTSTCIGEIAGALYVGPTPVPDAIRRCEALLRTEVPDRYGRANVEGYLGGLVAQRGDFDKARDLIDSARVAFGELGQRAVAAHFSEAILGEVELLAGDVLAAEGVFRWVCDELMQIHAYGHLASRAGDLAEALYELGRFDEAAEWTAVAERHSASDDLDARVLWMPVRAIILARGRALEEAEVLARDAVALAETTDALNRHAKALQRLGEILVLSGRIDDARDAFGGACSLFQEKGNLVGAARAHLQMNDAILV